MLFPEDLEWVESYHKQNYSKNIFILKFEFKIENILLNKKHVKYWFFIIVKSMFSIESRKNKAIFKKRIVNVVVRTFDFHKIVKSDIRQYLSFAAMF